MKPMKVSVAQLRAVFCSGNSRSMGKPEFARLAAISNGHLYNLRRHAHYRQRRRIYQKTRPAVKPIGERRRPDPKGRPGYLRVDTVHQGDTEYAKGVYITSTPSMR